VRLYTAVIFHSAIVSSQAEGRNNFMTKEDEKQVRSIVQDELLGIIGDAQESMGVKKDPTGMGRRALEGLADMIRSRKASQADDE
jgi:hypothetical protein